MADTDAVQEGKKFYEDIPMQTPAFFLRGAGSLDWGMKNRLARIFNPETGRTVMLAIDHGYFQGPTTGLERVDLNIVPLMPMADALMLTRGILRTTVPPAITRPIVMRCSGGPSILKELSNEELAVDIEDAIRMNVCALTLQVFIGGEHETRSVHNMTRLVDVGMRYGIPTMAVTAVGKELTRDAQYLRLACRICAELGAQIVKTYYCADDFETVTASCPVPIVMALVTYAAFHGLLYHTRFGTYIFALGGNREALRYAGLSPNKLLIAVYAIGGAMAGIAGLLMTARMNSGHPTAGLGLEFDAIAAVAVGGTSFERGNGWLLGTLLGVLSVGVLRNGLNLISLPSSVQVASVGVLVIVALFLDGLRSRA